MIVPGAEQKHQPGLFIPRPSCSLLVKKSSERNRQVAELNYDFFFFELNSGMGALEGKKNLKLSSPPISVLATVIPKARK